VVLGGGHSLSAPMLRALAGRFGPDGYLVVQFDTHADTGAEVHGVVNSHGTPFYRGVVEGWLRGANVVQVGLRGAWPGPEEFAWMRERGFRWRTMTEVTERGIGAVAGDAIARTGSGRRGRT
jgi:arginase family enzyme